ncbi:MAG: 2-keto-4-pentenoate hydratase/2-oxohepta-3-ene-1,7-dioic acid hydratase in catechol pathway [Myxococcota bacterium]|jgi:2-keto-4-pentenoate hydratase/2-oxohepta-3-ene-1,7-dioic acid hydratase in catechol pathway
MTHLTLTPAKVNAIYCVGRNYAAHAVELGNAVPKAPLIFTKSRTCIVPFADDLSLPTSLGRCDHELEIAVRVGASLSEATPDACLAAVSHVGLALDLTLRAAQDALKARGHPWDLAKSFAGACPLSELQPAAGFDLADLHLTLTINGVVRQTGHCRQMLFSIGTLLSFLSHRIPLVPGDLVLTGTPAGVGPLSDGDVLVGMLCGAEAARATVRR